MGNGKTFFNITDYFPGSKGIPSSPVVTYNPNNPRGTATIYISTSRPDPGKTDPADPWQVPGWGTGKLKYWREKF